MKLPGDVDLGEPADSATYARASTRVTGRTPSNTLTARGRPILFAVSVPAKARHRDLAERFVAFLLSPDGRRILRQQRFDALAHPTIVGEAPTAIKAVASER